MGLIRGVRETCGDFNSRKAVAVSELVPKKVNVLSNARHHRSCRDHRRHRNHGYHLRNRHHRRRLNFFCN